MVSISVTVCARMARFGKCPYTGAFDQYIIVEDTGSALWLGRRGVLLERERGKGIGTRGLIYGSGETHRIRAPGGIDAAGFLTD